MRRALLLVPVVLAALPGRAAPPPPPLSDEERAFCEREVELVEKRQKLFEAQGIAAAEIARRNQEPLRDLADCRERFKRDSRSASEQQEDLAEVQRRAGKDATELERERVWREVRRERLASKHPSALTREEKAELAAGAAEELAATHAALDRAHERDPQFMRVLHSALTCYHGARKAELQEAIGSEEAMLKLGTGDRQRLYALRSQVRESEAVLARSQEATRGALERCSDKDVAVLAHCLGVRYEGREEPACAPEQIQQYIRLVK